MFEGLPEFLRGQVRIQESAQLVRRGFGILGELHLQGFDVLQTERFGFRNTR